MTRIPDQELIPALTRYFSQPYAQPVSYYNAFSCINLAGKLKRKYQIRDVKKEGFYIDDEQLILHIEGSVDMNMVIAPRNNEKMLVNCRKLKKENAHVIVHAPDFPLHDPAFRIIREYKQVLYDCSAITEQVNEDLKEHTENILGSRSRTSFRKNQRECGLRKGTPDDRSYYESILQHWVQQATAKGESTASISKDIQCFDWEQEQQPLRSFIGFRGAVPVSYSFLTPIPAHENIGTVLATKSLNYRSQPGGYNETSVWEIIEVCRIAPSLGIDFLNASGADNHAGLNNFKKRFITNTNPIEAYDYEYTG